VLVFGANGYIGYNVCIALRRNGYNVVGVVRSADKGTELAKQEIVPLVADVEDLKSLEAPIAKADIILDMIERQKDGFKVNEGIRGIVEAVGKTSGTKKCYVYTSGCMDYGNHPGKVIDETTVCTQGYLKGRVEFCQSTMASKDANGIAVRPAWVYGASFGNYLPTWFQSTGEIEIKGNPDKTYPWVHVYDLADFYVKLLATPKAYGQMFDVSDSTRITDKEARLLFARAAGNKELKVKMSAPDEGAWGVISETSMTTSSQKAKTVLGWEPKFGPMQDEVTPTSFLLFSAWATGAKKH